MPTRRDFLTALVALGVPAGEVLASGETSSPQRRRQPRPLPRVNGGIGIAPVRRLDNVTGFEPPLIVPELVALQLREVYELGFRAVRVTLSFNEFGPDFFAAIPYVRAARALGIDVLGIIGQFGHGFDLMRALWNPDRRRRVLEAYYDVFAQPIQPVSRAIGEPGKIAFQVFNEPTESRGLQPADYVRHFLAPTYADLKSIDPAVRVVSAAPVGRRAGLFRLREMLIAGLERACDTVGVHVYNDNLIDDLDGLVALPVEVTESGVIGPERHLPWVLDVFPRIREALAPVVEIHFFDLFDGLPGGFRIIDIVEEPGGAYRVEIESPALHAHLRGRVTEAMPARRYAQFEDLIPDIRRFFPQEEDFARVDSAR